MTIHAQPTSTVQTLLRERLVNRTARIGVIGLGYVGLPLALRFEAVGYEVLGFDIDAEKVAALSAGQSYIGHIPGSAIASARRLTATTDFSQARVADALIICVPTPLGRHREPDLRYVTATLEAIAPHLREGQVISLESTTYPGTTEEEVLPRLRARGLVPGQDVFVVYSPEREDPGNAAFTTATIPKVIGGHTRSCLDIGRALYGHAIEKLVPVSSTRAAEMTKLVENIQRAVNIGLMNEMKLVCDRMDIDLFEVIDAAATKPFGFTRYYPGPGLGGHCIPIDPFYLTWKAREYGLHTRFIELAGEVNQAMPEFVIGKLVSALNQAGKALKSARILVLGVAYKKNVDDLRESPSLRLMELIRAGGGKVAYSDPHVPLLPRLREHRFDLASVPITPQTLGQFDAVVLATDHDKFDFRMILDHAPLIVDSRGVYRKPAPHVVRA